MDSVKVVVGDKTIECAAFEGIENEKSFDIGKLRDQTGYVTFDNGYANTAPVLSDITYLDGDNGVLRYRGYPIEQLAEKATFLEVAYLLIYGDLPKKAELEKFTKGIEENQTVDASFVKLFDAFPKATHPMAMLTAATVALSGQYPKENEINNKASVEKTIYRLLGQFPALCAAAYRHSKGEARIAPQAGLDYCSNFMQQMYAKDSSYAIPKEIVKALNLLLILHADHEQNCSTSTVRLVGSSNANLYASIAAGITALWGPLHGGANQAVMEMLDEIQKSGGDIKATVAKAKDKASGFKLMGFGHRVYKNFDPRAKIIKKACDVVLNSLGIKNPLLALAQQLEEAALTDSYFVEKKLYPNVDFYSGIIYSALNIPVEMFTPMFALGRMPGWIAQWKEMVDGGTTKIGRPRQIYTGHAARDYAPVDAR
ncbi:MAG: citrate synthase [Proteobacteria bacterium]|nr:MAG: citrate synthase [Pseudomonadota bacterium]